jgi:hypothetical protein
VPAGAGLVPPAPAGPPQVEGEAGVADEAHGVLSGQACQAGGLGDGELDCGDAGRAGLAGPGASPRGCPVQRRSPAPVLAGLEHAHTGDLIASAESAGRPTGIRFDGPSRLIVTSVLRDAGYVRAWYLDGAQAEFLAFASVYAARNPVVIPGRDHIGVLATRGSRVRVFEGVTLRKARAPKGFPGQAVRRQWNSADDRIWVLAGAKSATVFPGRHSVLTVADRPPTEWGPADQGIVAEALGSPDVDAAARPLLDLLQARLACRAILPGKPRPDTGADHVPGGMPPPSRPPSPCSGAGASVSTARSGSRLMRPVDTSARRPPPPARPPLCASWPR